MIGRHKKISLNEALLLVRNRDEAVQLITATLVSSQMESTIKATRLSVEHQLLLGVLQQDVRIHGNPLSTTLLPLLAGGRRQVQDSIDSQLKILQRLTEECTQVHASLKLFAGQNMALSEELKSTGNKLLAQQKLLLGQLETDMCKKILSDLEVATRRGLPDSTFAAGGNNGECSVRLSPLRMAEQQLNQQSVASSSSHGRQSMRNNQHQETTTGNHNNNNNGPSGNVENIQTDTNAVGCRVDSDETNLNANEHDCNRSSLTVKRHRDGEGAVDGDGGSEDDDGQDQCSKRRHVATALLSEHAYPAENNEAVGQTDGKTKDKDNGEMITTPSSSQTMFSAGKDVSITSTKAEFGTANSPSDSSGVKPSMVFSQ